MRILIGCFCVLTCSFPVIAGALDVSNGDFEQPALGSSVPGWHLEQHAGPPAYEMMVIPDEQKQDNSVFRIHRTKAEMYGRISQEVALNTMSDSEIEMVARMKSAQVGPEGWVLVLDFIGRPHRALPPSSIKQIRSERIIGNSPWHTVSLRTTIPQATTAIEFGAMLLDSGTGWIDDIQVRTIP